MNYQTSCSTHDVVVRKEDGLQTLFSNVISIERYDRLHDIYNNTFYICPVPNVGYLFIIVSNIKAAFPKAKDNYQEVISTVFFSDDHSLPAKMRFNDEETSTLKTKLIIDFDIVPADKEDCLFNLTFTFDKHTYGR